MHEPLALPAINRLLRANTWALEKLKAHAGKTALLACPPFDLRLTIAETGEAVAALPESPSDVTIAVTPGVLLRLAAQDDTAWSAAQVTGDVQFAAAIDDVRRNLEWDYEEDLSRLFGDIAAHRVAGALSELNRWGRAAALNLAQALAEYSIHEQPMLASSRAVDEFNRDVDELRDHAARLEKRLELLQRRVSRASGGGSVNE
jgi:ubiquinone biosynthesis protein UbiJ